MDIFRYIEEGLQYLNIYDTETILYIHNAIYKNTIVNIAQEKHQKIVDNYKNRFVIPFGKSKKWYKDILTETRDILESIKITLRDTDEKNSVFLLRNQEQYTEKYKKLQMILKRPSTSKADVSKAKMVPIESILDFSKSNVRCCIFHEEKTASMYLYRKTNTVHCFGCNTNADVIDVFMKINNVSFMSALHSLSSY